MPRYSVQAHSSIINTIDGVGGSQIHCGAPEIVTGGRDGAVRVWDPRVNEPVLALETQVVTLFLDTWGVALLYLTSSFLSFRLVVPQETVGQ